MTSHLHTKEVQEKRLEAIRSTKKLSLRAAINAKCKDCIYDDLSGLGTWRQQVTGCPCVDCALHAVRPQTKGAKP